MITRKIVLIVYLMSLLLVIHLAIDLLKSSGLRYRIAGTADYTLINKRLELQEDFIQ